MDLRLIIVDENNNLRKKLSVYQDGSDIDGAEEIEQLMMDNFEVDMDELEDQEEFGVPIIGFLKCDVDAGEGEVILPQEFYQQNNIWKLDVLGDMIGALQAITNDIHKEEYFT